MEAKGSCFCIPGGKKTVDFRKRHVQYWPMITQIHALIAEEKSLRKAADPHC
jgi:hypothetical protein